MTRNLARQPGCKGLRDEDLAGEQVISEAPSSPVDRPSTRRWLWPGFRGCPSRAVSRMCSRTTGIGSTHYAGAGRRPILRMALRVFIVRLTATLARVGLRARMSRRLF